MDHRVLPTEAREGQDVAPVGWIDDTMLRLGDHIRLTRKEAEEFLALTGIRPEGIRTPGDLQGYVDRCKAHYWGHSDDTKFLHWLIDRHHSNCQRSA